jgi:GT2 family glycosyltransferase
MLYSLNLIGYSRDFDYMVYDNYPLYNNLNSFSDGHVTYIADYNNSGVSKAYNCAAEIARNINKKYLLFLDQDTKIDELFFKKVSLLSPDNKLIVPILLNKGVVISPCKYVLGHGSSLSRKELNTGLNNLNRRSFLNSGTIINLEVFQKSGGYNEDLPLYFSDFNFFEKVRKNISEYYLLDSEFHHEMASNDESNLEEFLVRFEYYCIGAMKCYDGFWGKVMMFMNILFRGIKKTIAHKKIVFLNIVFKTLRHG